MTRLSPRIRLTGISTLACLGIFLAASGNTQSYAQSDRTGAEASAPTESIPPESSAPTSSDTSSSAGGSSSSSSSSSSGGASISTSSDSSGGDSSTSVESGRSSRAKAPRDSFSSKSSTGLTASFSFTNTNKENLVLRLESSDEGDVQAVEGGEFITDMRLVNPGEKPFDAVRLILDYNPAYLEPLSINDSALRAFLTSDPTSSVNKTSGQITYEASLSAPISVLKVPMVFIKWRALKPVLHTKIGFGDNKAGDFTELFYNGKKILGETYEDGDGTVSVSVKIIPADPDEALTMQEDPQLYLGTDEQIGNVTLQVIPPDATPRVGEQFTLDIVLDNSAHSQLDGVAVLLQYDPEVLEILDSDLDNWITLGSNILDGSFHDNFPFDYHMANSVMASRGIIDYRVGTSQPWDFLGTEGTMARIVARAKKPTAATTIQFLFANRPGQLGTEVVYLGQDALGDPTVRGDGVRGVKFPVLPAK